MATASPPQTKSAGPRRWIELLRAPTCCIHFMANAIAIPAKKARKETVVVLRGAHPHAMVFPAKLVRLPQHFAQPSRCDRSFRTARIR